MAGSWREDPSGRYHRRYRDEDGWWTEQVKTADGAITNDPKGVRGTGFLDHAAGAGGRSAFRVAVAIVVSAPAAVIVLAFSALSAGFCQDSKPADQCPSMSSTRVVFWGAMVVMAVALLVCLAVLINGATRGTVASVDATPPPLDAPVRTNTKATVSAVFAGIAGLASLWMIASHGGVRGLVGVFLAVPTALLATVFGLRALAEVRDALGCESGVIAAEVGVAIGAMTAVGWTVAAVAGF
jgi:hypothetical protein